MLFGSEHYSKGRNCIAYKASEENTSKYQQLCFFFLLVLYMLCIFCNSKSKHILFLYSFPKVKCKGKWLFIRWDVISISIIILNWRWTIDSLSELLICYSNKFPSSILVQAFTFLLSCSLLWSGSFRICDTYSCDVSLRQTFVVFCWGKTHGRTNDVWRKYKYYSMDSDSTLA